jgi:hypothetical protein
MEEKKLTDEEIVKAYEYCVVQHRDCDGCPYDGWGCPIKGGDVVEAFYRLQDENKGLKERGEIVINSLHETIDKQKAEIERLTEYNANLNGMCLEFIDKNTELQKKVENQKAELKAKDKAIEKEQAENKRLYDEYVRLDDFCANKGCICCVCEKKKTCKECSRCKSLKTEKCNGFKIDISKYARAIERADKLQKQVDELNAKQIIECYGMLKGCDMVNQAVKDTAMEVYSAVLEFCPVHNDGSYSEFIKLFEEWLKYKYGVEVE